MKIVHIADLHLGIKQYGLQKRYEDFFVPMDFLLNFVYKNHTNMVLIAGDIFDKRSPDYKSLTVFGDFVNTVRNSGIDVLGITGNHCHTRGKTWRDYFNIPANFENDVIRVNGVDWHKSPIKYLPQVRDNKFNIAMIHQGITKYGGVLVDNDLNSIKELGYNHVAAGHIHIPHVYDILFNPGSTEFTSALLWDKPGGLIYFTVDDGILGSWEHVITPHRTSVRLRVVCNGDVELAINEAKSLLESVEDDAMVQLTFTGFPRITNNTVSNLINDNSTRLTKLIVLNSTQDKAVLDKISGRKDVDLDSIYEQVFNDVFLAKLIMKSPDDIESIVQVIEQC